ncbi:MAG: thioredoxin family protein [Nitrospira sp.]|nr:thioredoxin family protein [Nitrospira sp.]MCA9480569.1 thioredoxin family protein [Nitrospira sp.]
MALTVSTMLPLGTSMPHFELPDVCSGVMVRSSDFVNYDAVLVMFLCRHCPYVVHIKNEVARLGQDYQGKSVGIVAISSNDAKAYPLDAPPSLAEMAKELGLTFPLCYDETQEVAKAFTAACTPDFFVFDRGLQLAYRGQLDDSRPGNGKAVTGRDLRAALDAILAGQPVPKEQRPSAGCNIKWKSGYISI